MKIKNQYFLCTMLSVLSLLCLNLTAKSQCSVSSTNAGFEQPVVSSGFQLINDNLVPGWKTTATDHKIEIWHTGFYGVPAYQGTQFAEINATQNAALYQEISFPTGGIVQIHFAHRGRSGVDVMSLKAGPPGGPYTTIGTYSDGNSKWGYYSGINYIVPAGQTTTRFLFECVSSAGGPSFGNFLDDVGFIFTGLSTTNTQKNVSCNGGNDGSATIIPTSGTSPYTYLWSTGGTTATINNLKAGTYTVTVSDVNKCSIMKTITLTQPTILSVTTTHTNLTCNAGNNGSVTVTPSGGTKSYKYLWASGETTATIKNLVAGTYKVTITDSLLCTKADSIIITEPKALSDSIEQTQKISCNTGNNGAVKIAASGGTAPYKYLWSSGGTTDKITNLAAGTYKVTITDSLLCTKVDSITISEPTALSLVPNITDATCSNTKGTASVAVSGGTQPYTYLWSNGATTDTIINLQSSIYNVTVTDTNGCTATSANIAITDIQVTVASFSPVLKEGVAPVEVTFTNTSINAVSYLWSFGETATSTDSNPKYTYNDAGIYTVTLTAYSVNGCADTASGVVKVYREQSILWIPNVFTPNKDGKNEIFSAVSMNLTKFEAYIFNRWGEQLYEWNDADGGWDGTFQGRQCPDGVYVYIIIAQGIDKTKYNRTGCLTLIR